MADVNITVIEEVSYNTTSNEGQGPPGAPGEAFGLIDGGHADSNYGGTTPIDGGSA